MRTIKTNLIAVTALAILTAQRVPMANEFALHPASGGVIRLHNDHGGQLEAYRQRFLQARESGERVVIDGMCAAACTLAVGILPPGRVCVTPQAVLGFQSAWTPPPGMTGIAASSGGRRILEADRIPSARSTQHLMNIYPPML